MISRRSLLLRLSVSISGWALLRTGPALAALTQDQQAEIGQVQDYLNGIHTLASRFEQYSDNGATSEGQLYLARPGRMRFEYDPPVPILMVADGKDIHYYDKELQQVSELRVDDTPAAFLLRDPITLTGGVTVTHFEHRPGAIRLTMIETKQPGQGSVTLVLDDRPLQLRQWTVLDPQQNTVTVALTDPHYGLTIDPKLFYWTDPRPEETGH